MQSDLIRSKMYSMVLVRNTLESSSNSPNVMLLKCSWNVAYTGDIYANLFDHLLNPMISPCEIYLQSPNLNIRWLAYFIIHFHCWCAVIAYSQRYASSGGKKSPGYLSPVYNSDTDEACSLDGELEPRYGIYLKKKKTIKILVTCSCCYLMTKPRRHNIRNGHNVCGQYCRR